MRSTRRAQRGWRPHSAKARLEQRKPPVCVCACVCVCMCVCVCVCMYMHAYAYAHVYAYATPPSRPFSGGWRQLMAQRCTAAAQAPCACVRSRWPSAGAVVSRCRASNDAGLPRWHPHRHTQGHHRRRPWPQHPHCSQPDCPQPHYPQPHCFQCYDLARDPGWRPILLPPWLYQAAVAAERAMAVACGGEVAGRGAAVSLRRSKRPPVLRQLTTLRTCVKV